MRTSDKIWTGISVAALLFGLGAAVSGYVPLSIPCFAIGALLLWTTVQNYKKPGT